MTAAISRLMRRPASMARSATLLAVTLLAVLTATAQEPDKRHVTPVKPETNQVKPPPKGTDEKVIQQYLTGDSAAAVAEARKDSLLMHLLKTHPDWTLILDADSASQIYAQ